MTTIATDDGIPRRIFTHLVYDLEEGQSLNHSSLMGPSMSSLTISDIKEEVKGVIPKIGPVAHSNFANFKSLNYSLKSTSNIVPENLFIDIHDVNPDHTKGFPDPISPIVSNPNQPNANPISRPQEEIKESPLARRSSIMKQNSGLTRIKPKNAAKSKKPPKRKIDPEVLKLVSIIKEPTDGQGWSQVINEKNKTEQRNAQVEQKASAVT